jgi:glyoxalase family protein
MRQLQGIHHVTAVTSSAEDIYAFFTNTLGLRLVKKTVNQDDIRTYHLFFADDQGSPGTDMTFFDFRGSIKVKRGTNEIYKTGFRVTNHASLVYWQKRFQHYRIKHDAIKTLLGRSYLNFFDFDDQEYALFSDEGLPGIAAGEPWKKGPVPDEFAIVGLGPIFIRVNDLPLMTDTLVNHLGMRLVGKEHQYSIFEMGQGGNGGTVVIDNQPLMAPVIQGFGTVHHVAFRVTNRDDLEEWRIYYNDKGITNSGYVNRFYFESLYARVYPRVLFEIATDGPGFIDDEEPYETLGETLALPPQFRNRRELIQRMVRPIDTVRSKRVFKKEYFES